MFKTTVKYTDFLGGEREETLRFNLTELEMKDLMDSDVAFSPQFLTSISDDKDGDMMLKVIRKIILHAYGEMSEDGRYFRKSPEIMSDFAHSAAYTALLTKLFESEDENFISNFLFGIFPANVAEKMKEAASEESKKVLPMA